MWHEGFLFISNIQAWVKPLWDPQGKEKHKREREHSSPQFVEMEFIIIIFLRPQLECSHQQGNAATQDRIPHDWVDTLFFEHAHNKQNNKTTR